jgi:hypothetical protein
MPTPSYFRTPPMAHAVHESDHAIVEWLTTRAAGELEPGFSRILLRTREQALVAGRGVGEVRRTVHYEVRGAYVPDQWATNAAQLRKCMEREALVTLAGPASEGRRRHRSMSDMVSNDFGGDSDWAHVRKCAMDFSHTEEEGDQYALGVWVRTRRLLHQSAVWGAILALSEVLIEKRDMSAIDALNIMRASWGDAPMLSIGL